MGNAQKPAYPQHELDAVTGKVSQVMSRGLTKREKFAMAAMQGLLADGAGDSLHKEQVSKIAVSQADALLAELEE